MTEPASHLQIALKSIASFANDGRLDGAELEELLAIAEKDGSIDPDEARILGSVFDRLRPDELTPEVQARIELVRQRFP